MNSELVRKKYTQFKVLQPRASQDEFWAFDYLIQIEEDENGLKEHMNTYNEGRQNSYHNH
jgi:hypothetical protein